MFGKLFIILNQELPERLKIFLMYIGNMIKLHAPRVRATQTTGCMLIKCVSFVPIGLLSMSAPSAGRGGALGRQRQSNLCEFEARMVYQS